MCFSAKASFISSILLLIIGSVSLSKIKSKIQIPFCLIPIFFSIQQFSEGLLWIFLQSNFNYYSIVMTYIFLFFAFIFWPLWIPFSLYCLEKNKDRKNLIMLTFAVGILITFLNIYFIFVGGVYSEVRSNHINYILDLPNFYNFNLFLYLISTVLPFFISSIKQMKFFGSLLLFSLIITSFFYTKFFISVWCFFAAILSLCVYFVMAK